MAAAAEARVTTDGRGLLRGGQLYLGSEFQLRSFDWFGARGLATTPTAWDVREIDQSGVDEGHRGGAAGGRAAPRTSAADVWISTDASRPVWLSRPAPAAAGTLPRDGAPAARYWCVCGQLHVPAPPARRDPGRTSRTTRAPGRSRFVDRRRRDTSPLERAVPHRRAGSSPALSVTLRQQLVLTPRLTLQAYAQLYSSYGRYHRFRLATAHDGRIGFGDLDAEVQNPETDTSTSDWWDNPDFRTSSLNVNVVLRWEYRLGSTLYLVYPRSQSELGYPDGPDDPSPPHTIRPVQLGAGPTIDTFLVKWSYWWSR